MRVYHFLNAKYGLEALKKRRLKVSRIDDLNDPFEMLGTDLSDRKLRQAFLKTKSDLAKDCGLLCFSKRWRNPVLWSHYADRHRGLCLGFDAPDGLLFSVTYTTKRTAPDKLFSDDQSVKEKEMERILTTKFNHWRYEDEARFFVRLSDMDSYSGHYFFEFSEKLKLTQVLVGAEASISRSDIEEALGKENAYIERLKARAAFKTFNVVRNRKQSMWI
ncbi:MAG TPA: DUF2971 domain-containing protein [Kiloniellales bacterium]|jgi:hypothetical protein